MILKQSNHLCLELLGPSRAEPPSRSTESTLKIRPCLDVLSMLMSKDEISLVSTISVSAMDTTNSSATALSDGNSSELVEAVAALRVGRSSLPAKKALGNVVKVTDAGGADSGYASTNSSATSTPDSSKGTFVDGGAVVTKTRLPWSISSRKKIKLMPFDKPIPILTWNRFKDLRELHADNINKLTKGLARCRGILMTLKVLGESEMTAAPWVFVQCDSIIAGKVRRFFKQPMVESDFKPPHPDAYTPSFEIYVLELPPITLHKNLPSSTSPIDIRDDEKVEVYCEKNAISSLGSLCGSQISVFTSGDVRSATIGGLISLQSKEGAFPILGMTASHFLAEEQHIEYLGDGEEYIDDLDEVFSDQSDNSDVFELDISSFNLEAPLAFEQDAPKFELPEKSQSVIGHVYRTSQDDLQDQPNLDWALFTIEDSSLHLPSVVTEHEITLLKHPTTTEEDRKVILSTAMSGLVSGILSKSWSYLTLAPGRSLVRTNALTHLG